MEITSLRTSISHPNEHKLRFTTVGKTPYSLERANTLAGCVPFAREASFEIERPQSHGRSMVINVATSFVRHHEHSHTRHPTKIPAQSFPALPSISHRNNHASSSDSDKISVLKGKGLITTKSHFKRPKHEKLSAALPVNLSDEKQDWIARWIQNTNKALESGVESLPNIREQ